MTSHTTNAFSLKTWLALARAPFHSVGVLPFILGTALAWKTGQSVNLAVFGMGLTAVVLIMLTTYLNGECNDIEEDTLVGQLGPHPFSGGSEVLVRQEVPAAWVKTVSYVAVGLAAFLGLMIWIGFRTGSWTIPLGAAGMVAGFYYSARPLRWVEWGIGELLIGFCYGWLTVASAFYIQTGRLIPLVHWMALPIALTIFNVILINEFPDYPADRAVNKANLVVRLGPGRARYVYSAAAVLSWVLFVLAVRQGLPARAYLFYLPVVAASATVVALLFRHRDQERATLLVMCGLTILTNLGTTLAFLLALL